ncbi:MAG TPA: pyridoxal-dependent decarboxylase [Gemmatimonadaceae bacterium]|nr:pyridoxal-dependent decarboxylase [Gemmatimonadaceae bacterium]
MSLTLDPADWTSFRALAHRMVDDMLDHLSTLPEQPAWREMPRPVRESFNGAVPRDGLGDEAAYATFVDRVMPFTVGNLHPRFWGWVQGQGTPLAMMAEMLAAGINPHMAGFNQAPALVEHEVIRWLAELLGMPPDASGLLVSGGTLANTLGLAVARHAGAVKLGLDVREDGHQTDVGATPRGRMVFYGSSETHNWARKAAELLGLGNRSFRRVPVDEEYRIDVAALARMVAEDRAAGMLPFCVIGTAGTVNTGATDDLDALADYCREQSLWFHVDGAFGALVHLSAQLRPIVKGLERADSIGFDLHKWGSLPFECACVLVRDAEVHRAAFASSASYIAAMDRGVIAGGLPFAERGLDLTRNFRALKVWMSFISHGTDRLAAMIEQNVRQTQRLVERVEQHPELELMAPAPLNVACFRYVPAVRPDDATLDALNEEILLQLQEQGIAVPSGTRLGGRYAIRVANVNHRSREEDFETLMEAVVELGRGMMRLRET